MSNVFIEAPNPSPPRALPEERVIAVPDGTWDRVALAFRRALDYLPAEASSKLASVLDEDTLWAVAVVLAVWAGLHIVAIGALADVIMGALGALAIGMDMKAIFAATSEAADAETPDEMEHASRALAAGLSSLGIDVIIGWLTGRLMTQLKGAIRALRPSGSPNRWLGRKVREPAPKEPAGRRPGEEPVRTTETPLVPEPGPGLLGGVGTQYVGQKAAQVNWGAVTGVSLGVVAVGLLAVVALKRRNRTPRPDWRT